MHRVAERDNADPLGAASDQGPRGRIRPEAEFVNCILNTKLQLFAHMGLTIDYTRNGLLGYARTGGHIDHGDRTNRTPRFQARRHENTSSLT